MGRYMIVVKSGTLAGVEQELLRHGATSIKKHEHVSQLSAELDDAAAGKLAANQNISIKKVREIRPSALAPISTQRVIPTGSVPAVYSMQDYAVDDVTLAFSELRAYYTPALTGYGLTVAVLDTGIRKTHQALLNKVVYEYNATDSPSVGDVWGHGTGVASLICGEDYASGHVGVSPGAVVMNIKVINDDGVASTETIVEGINKVVELVRDARFAGLHPTDSMYPNILNISIGGEDTGDEEDPILLAARSCVNDWQTDIVAAAGNFGPDSSTITAPGTDPAVITVGGSYTGTVDIWENSSRGPTLLGDTKPDLIAWATGLVVASNKDDSSYETKSGTSFSTPIIAGLTGLLWETGRLSLSEIIASLYVFRWTDILPYAPYFCVKPYGAAVAKDNTYGYGSPAGSVMMQNLSGGAVSTTQEFMEQVPTLMMMVMMMGMVMPMMG